jgi:hypothetical protein
MKIILSALLAFAVQDVTAAEKASEPAKKDVAVPEKIPAKASEDDAPTVRIRTRDNGDVAEEYVQGGVVTMVKVTPTRGKPYYIMDNNGDGRLDKADAEAAGGVVPVSWIIAEW